MAIRSPGQRRFRARTAKVEFPLVVPSSPFPTKYNYNYLESQFETIPFLSDFQDHRTSILSQDAFSQFLSLNQNGVPVEKLKTTMSNGTLPVRRPPLPINAKLRSQKHGRGSSQSVKIDKVYEAEESRAHGGSKAFTKVNFKVQNTTNVKDRDKQSANRKTKTKNPVPEADFMKSAPNQSVFEERESPVLSESLHMDQAGIKHFPTLGPNDRHIKILSLQNNFISRLNNLVVLNHLLILDLYCNKLERISGLLAFHNLRVLLLGKNRIRRIEGLESLRYLEILDLHGNQLRYLDNLKSLDSLRILNVAGNAIRSIRNFGSSELSSLAELNLKRNRIKTLNGIDKAPNLRKLLVSNNEIQSVSSLIPLRKLSGLEELVLESNPVCSVRGYISQVLGIAPSLATLDRVKLSEKDFLEAQNWVKQGHVVNDEPSVKKAQKKAAFETLSSREDVICQARKRWESIKDFVTKSNSIDRKQRKGKLKPRARSESRQGKTEISEGPSNFQKPLMRQTSSLEALIPPQILETPPCLHLAHNAVPKSSNENCISINQSLETQRNITKDGSEECQTNEKQRFTFEHASYPKLAKVAIIRPRVRTPLQVQRPNLFQEKGDPEPRKNGSVSKEGGRKSDYDLEPRVQSGVTEAFSETAERNQFGRLRSSSCIFPGIPVDEYENSRKEMKDGINKEAERVDKSQRWSGCKSQIKSRKPFFRSSSADTTCQYSDDSESATTSTTNTSDTPVTTRRRRSSASTARPGFPLKFRQRGQTARSSRISVSPKISSNPNRPMTGTRGRDVPKSLKRVNSLSTIASPIPETVKKQGGDYLIEIDGKTLSLYGQGALKHFLTGFAETLTENVECIKFHFITFDGIVPYFGRLRQTYPTAEHFYFRANGLTVLAQINALADLQGLLSIDIIDDGNPITRIPFWEDYAMYRLAHWGLKQINGKDVISQYRGGASDVDDESMFESLGYLTLSCLPQATLTPLASKLHTLQAFCCCSQSSSSDDSGGIKATTPSDSICNSWEEDPVLLDVIGKEALVYDSTKSDAVAGGCKDLAAEVVSAIAKDGSEMVQKMHKFEENLSAILETAIQDILTELLSNDGDSVKKEFQQLKAMSQNFKKY